MWILCGLLQTTRTISLVAGIIIGKTLLQHQEYALINADKSRSCIRPTGQAVLVAFPGCHSAVCCKMIAHAIPVYFGHCSCYHVDLACNVRKLNSHVGLVQELAITSQPMYQLFWLTT